MVRVRGRKETEMPPNFNSNYRMSQLELNNLLKPNLNDEGENLSKIARFYNGRSVLVTGATGFVGRLLIEKLLRACVGIKRVFLLVRPKQGKIASQRIEELTESIVFDGVRQLGLDLSEKLVPIEGNLTEDCLGLPLDQLDLLAQEVSVVFHSAASVNFTEPLRDAVFTNIAGALNAIKLAKRLPKLQAFVYVSTAYSNCYEPKEIKEQIYPTEIDAEALLLMAETMNRDSMEKIKQSIMGSFPNTYTFTKNLAESLCLRHACELPIVVCRPSVVVCSWHEPIEGFVDNINGGNGINYGPASGLSVVMEADNEVVLDYVPVDYVVNCIISLGWFCANFHKSLSHDYGATTNMSGEQQVLFKKMKNFREKNLEELPHKLAQVPVFNITSGSEVPITMGSFKKRMVANANQYPTLQLYRCPRMTYLRSKRMYKISRFFQNTLVAKFFDFIYCIKFLRPEVYDKSDPIAKKSFAFRSERIDHFGQTIAFFLKRQWDFRHQNRQMLIDDFMDDEDRRLFACDMRQLNWDEYCKTYALGIRKFLLKEPDETIDRARLRLNTIKDRDDFISSMALNLFIFCIILFVLY